MKSSRWSKPVLVAALAGAFVLAHAAGPAPAPAGKQAAAAFKETNWDDLVPKDWDPMKQFRAANLGVLSDSDPRAVEMLQRMRDTWDNAPTNNTLDDQPIRIPGYVVPLEESKAGMSEFLLVPYLGACIHTPPPPANQIIHVKLPQAKKGLHMMDAVWVSGRIKTLRSDTAMGASGYRMDAAGVDPYVDKKPAN
ncbi:MAG: DUF3299 domain-containing protein [Rhizobacter sp.]